MSKDFCNKEGALKIKRTIESYWLRQGYKVNVELVEGGFTPTMRSCRFDIRSNLVNGKPTPSMKINIENKMVL